MRYSGLFLGLVLCIQGCASSAPGARGTSRDIITREQIAETQAITAYDAIRTLHPQWLRARGQTASVSDPGPLTPTVFLDSTPYGRAGCARRVPGPRHLRDTLSRSRPGGDSLRDGLSARRHRDRLPETVSLERHLTRSRQVPDAADLGSRSGAPPCVYARPAFRGNQSPTR